jgi:methionyl-tRNA synthetase
LTPIELCDKYVGEFQHLNERLHVSNDYYVRTTLDKHHETSQWLWKKAAAKGDIYHGAYEGYVILVFIGNL